MFERFSERARHVVVLAQEEARATFHHDYIGTEHLLVALLREREGIAARVLTNLGIGLDEVRTQVVEMVGTGTEPPSGRIPFTPRAKKTLELSLTEALSLTHNYIGTEHILLGLARQPDAMATRILTALGLSADRVHHETLAMLTARRPDAPARLTPSVPEDSDWSWFAGVGPVLRGLGGEIERHHGRPPDSGDLLLALTAYSTVAARALQAAGVDLAALTPEAIAAARRSGQSDVTELDPAVLAALRARLGVSPPTQA